MNGNEYTKKKTHSPNNVHRNKPYSSIINIIITNILKLFFCQVLSRKYIFYFIIIIYMLKYISKVNLLNVNEVKQSTIFFKNQLQEVRVFFYFKIANFLSYCAKFESDYNLATSLDMPMP